MFSKPRSGCRLAALPVMRFFYLQHLNPPDISFTMVEPKR